MYFRKCCKLDQVGLPGEGGGAKRVREEAEAGGARGLWARER